MLSLEGKAEFRIDDIYSLPFESDRFDVVMTDLVSQFLGTERALRDLYLF